MTIYKQFRSGLFFLLVVLGSFYSSQALANNSSQISCDTIPDPDSNQVIFEEVEVEAEFKDGPQAWLRWLIKNLNGDIATKNGAPAGQYTVVVQFIVNKEGNLDSIKALTRHGFGMEAEVLRVLYKSPKWSPAIQNGRPVKAYRKQPVTFQVIEEKKKNKRDKS